MLTQLELSQHLTAFLPFPCRNSSERLILRLSFPDATNKEMARDQPFYRTSVVIRLYQYARRIGADESDVNVGVVNSVRNGKKIDSVSADRAHSLGVDTDGSIYVSGASRMTVMKITRAR